MVLLTSVHLNRSTVESPLDFSTAGFRLTPPPLHSTESWRTMRFMEVSVTVSLLLVSSFCSVSCAFIIRVLILCYFILFILCYLIFFGRARVVFFNPLVFQVLGSAIWMI